MPARSTRSSIGAVAIWTSVDLPGLGDQLLGRVIEQELLARLPGWRMTLHAPLGWERPSIADGGIVAEPLGDRSPNRVTELAAATTLSVVCPSFPLGLSEDALATRYADERAGTAADYFTGGLGPDSTHPVVPFAIRVPDPVPGALLDLLARAPSVTVRDSESRDRLVAAGLEQDVAVVPHPALLLRRIVDLNTLPVRARQLRQLDVLPADDYVVALGEGAIPADLPDLGQVVAPPADLTFEDRLAVLAAARFVVATDEHVAAACAGLGVPWVLVDPDGTHRPVALEFGTADQITGSFAALPAPVAPKALSRKENRVAVGAALDRLAEFAAGLAGDDLERGMAAVAGENAGLRHAHWQQRQRMLVERTRLAEPLAQAWRERDDAVTEAAELRAANAELTGRCAELSARLAQVEQELAAWGNTKLVRWTKPLREVYGKARG